MTQVNAAAKMKTLTLVPTLARTAVGSGSAIDLLNYEGVAKIILDSAAGTGTTPTLDVTLQESDNGTSGWVDVDSTVAFVEGAQFVTVGAAASAQERHFNVSERKRFIRELHTIQGTTPSFTFSVKLIAGKKYD